MPKAAKTPIARRAGHSSQSLARRLRLQQFAIFQKVLEAGSILAASRELAMTQPAVSKAIHELEQQVGGVLFERSKRGVVLTEFGIVFERRAKSMMSELRYLAEDINAWQSGTAGHVIVGSLIVASSTLLPEAILRVRAQSPDIAVTVRVGSNATLFPALARGELDVVVGYLPLQPEAPSTPVAAALQHQPLYAESLCVVVGSEHPLAHKRKLRLADLEGCEWVVPTTDSTAFAAARTLFESEGLQMPRLAVESVSILTNLGLLSGGAMVALMQRSAAERFAAAGLLTILPLPLLKADQPVGYTVRAGHASSAAVLRFIGALQEASKTLQVQA